MPWLDKHRGGSGGCGNGGTDCKEHEPDDATGATSFEPIVSTKGSHMREGKTTAQGADDPVLEARRFSHSTIRGVGVFLLGVLAMMIIVVVSWGSPSFMDVAPAHNIADSCCAIGAAVRATSQQQASEEAVFVAQRLSYNQVQQ